MKQDSSHQFFETAPGNCRNETLGKFVYINYCYRSLVGHRDVMMYLPAVSESGSDADTQNGDSPNTSPSTGRISE